MLFVNVRGLRSAAAVSRHRLLTGGSASQIQRLQGKAAAGSIGRGMREVGKGIKSGRFARRRFFMSAPAAMKNRMVR